MSEHVRVNGENHMRPQTYTKNYGQQKKAGVGGFPQETSKLVVQCLVISLENIHASNIIQTEQVVFRNIYAPTNKYAHYF